VEEEKPEQLYKLSVAFEMATGIRKHRSLLYRWATSGVTAANGKRVLLNHTRLGRDQYCTLSDVRAFMEACNARLKKPPRPTLQPSAMSQRERDQRLRALGIRPQSETRALAAAQAKANVG
jgi:hypothetical protein